MRDIQPGCRNNKTHPRPIKKRVRDFIVAQRKEFARRRKRPCPKKPRLLEVASPGQGPELSSLGYAPRGEDLRMLAKLFAGATGGEDIGPRIVRTHGAKAFRNSPTNWRPCPARRSTIRHRVRGNTCASWARRPEVGLVDDGPTPTFPAAATANGTDVQEILSAEIDVLSTLNISTSKACSDRSRITGITVRETLPTGCAFRTETVMVISLPKRSRTA